MISKFLENEKMLCSKICKIIILILNLVLLNLINNTYPVLLSEIEDKALAVASRLEEAKE